MGICRGVSEGAGTFSAEGAGTFRSLKCCIQIEMALATAASNRPIPQLPYGIRNAHGKSTSSSRTISQVRIGASGPASRTRNPVIGSLMMRALKRFRFAAVSTIRSSSTAMSSESPARIPNFRRSGPGSTIWPFVETLVCMVRQPYPENSSLGTDRPVPCSLFSAFITSQSHQSPPECSSAANTASHCRPGNAASLQSDDCPAWTRSAPGSQSRRCTRSTLSSDRWAA